MDEYEDLEITGRVMSDKTLLPVTITIMYALMIVTALELAATHPGLGKSKLIIDQIRRKFRQAVTARYPDAQRGASTKVLAKAMSDERPLSFSMTIGQAWMLVSAVQLTLRHPGISADMAQPLEDLARQFQGSVIEIHPEAAGIIERGWNPEFDR